MKVYIVLYKTMYNDNIYPSLYKKTYNDMFMFGKLNFFILINIILLY